SLYNAVNFNMNIYRFANQTVQAAQINTLLCPSDASVNRRVVYSDDLFDTPKGRAVVRFSSYAGNAGTWYHHVNYDPAGYTLTPTLTSQDNGMFYLNSVVNFAAVKDGLSQTLLFGERNHEVLRSDAGAYDGWHWWFDGYYGDSLFWTAFPINPQKKLNTFS